MVKINCASFSDDSKTLLIGTKTEYQVFSTSPCSCLCKVSLNFDLFNLNFL